MSPALLSASLGERLVSFAWQEWAQMGLLIAPSCASPWAQDPEALAVFTMETGREEPRLFDELLDWMLHNEPMLSVRRLRAMCVDEIDRQLVDATVRWMARHRPRARLGTRSLDEPDLGAPIDEWLFRADVPVREPDPDFAAAGLLRPVLYPSGKSVPPDLMTPINLAFRLRAILGVGIRSEIVRIMLTNRAAPATAQTLARASGYSKRNVHEALGGLAEAQVIAAFRTDGEQRYAINAEIWSALLQLDPSRLPAYRAWPQLLSSLRTIQRWSREQDELEASEYMHQSATRQLLGRISGDLAFAGIPVNPKMTAEQAPPQLERVLDYLLAQLNPEAADH